MEPPLFPTSGPQIVRAAPGSAASLVLPVPFGAPPFQYKWSRAGASLDERFIASDDAGGVRLTVSAARTGDSGVYTLQASNAAGKDTARVRLEVSPDEAPEGDDPPNFLRRLQDLTVKVGTRTRFLVEIVSSTECKVTWYRNERRLMETERVALVRDGNFWCADVATVSVDDAGRWTCTAENVGGRASCSAHLNVLVPKAYKRPEFVEELRALLTEQGTVSLECKVVGVPTPVLRWFKDSREIKAGDVFALTANAEDPTSLGTYTCEAVNCMGRAYSSSKVHVVGRVSREGSARTSSGGFTPDPPPIFTKELEDQFVRICDPLTLSCHIVVPPWPRSVVWYNKEGKIEPSERYHVLEDGVGGYLLEVTAAEWADEGEWKCVASTAGGRVGMSTCYVSMDVPKNYRKPRFMENLQAVLTEEGLVSFECKVVGFPTPVLSWFKDGQELKPGDVYQLTGTNSLGSYCCIARNCMGQASSSAELTVEDIQNQLNEEEKHQLFSKNQAPKFLQGLKSVEAKIDEPFRFTIKVAIPPEPSLLWYRDDQPVDESSRCHHGKEERGVFYLDIQNLEFLDQAEWKCVAINDFGQSVTSCFLKLVIPRHYKKPRFLENLQAILSDEGAVNLECKVIGVPQPVLKWYKDGEELKPGDIHRIISGQDGTCCLGTYTCEAQNCMGIAASSASLLGFDDSLKVKSKKKSEEQTLQRNLSLSTIHEERTSQMYDTPLGDRTLDDKGEISFSFDGKEVSVSLYETPDLTEEEALQIVEMYADQLSENVTEHNVVELPPLRFVKETSTSGNLLMEAIIIDVSPEYFTSPEEDLRTEADIEDMSIADENGPPQISFDQDQDISGQDYLEKTMALLSDEKADIPKKIRRKKSDSQKSGDDYFSLSREQSLSDDKKDDDTQVFSESDLQSFASARSSEKPKTKIFRHSVEEPAINSLQSTEISKNIVLKEDVAIIANVEPDIPKPKRKRERRNSKSSRRSSSGSEKSLSRSKDEIGYFDVPQASKKLIADEEYKAKINNITNCLSKLMNNIQLIERDIILQSELMSSAATASKSLEIIGSLITPISEIYSIMEAVKEIAYANSEINSTLFNNFPQPLKALYQSLTIIEKCIDVESDNKTLVKKTCVSLIENCGNDIQNIVNEMSSLLLRKYIEVDDKLISDIELLSKEIITTVRFSKDTVKARSLLHEASEFELNEPSLEIQHSKDTQRAIFELKTPLHSLLRIVESAERDNLIDGTNIKNCEIILNDMSASIQELQEALEQIESLSVKESTSSLMTYNTEIIETVMDSVLKLRTSFEQLSIEAKKEENENILKQVLLRVKENLNEISSHIDIFENKIGKFDILQSENKLEVLQKMAQILIQFENSLPSLDVVSSIKCPMVTFHKSLTKVLENVIESNDATKYFAFMEICDSINRLYSSVKNIEANEVISLTSISNALKIVQDQLTRNVFESELNSSLLNNIQEIQMNLLENINLAEEISFKTESDHVRDLPPNSQEKSKAYLLMEKIEQSIAAITNVLTEERATGLKTALMPIFENIQPTLVDLKQKVASMTLINVQGDDHTSEISEKSVSEHLAHPILELNQNILILNQTLVESVNSLKANSDLSIKYAQSLQELQTTLEILQQNVIYQCSDDILPYDIADNIANVVQNLQNCIVYVYEQSGIETADEMSTLEDVSAIKTTADIIPSDHLLLPTTTEVNPGYLTEILNQSQPDAATATTLQSLYGHVALMQHPDVIELLDSLSEISDYTNLKSVAIHLSELNEGVQEIFHTILENSNELVGSLNTSKLIEIAEPIHDLHQSLSVIDASNIPIYESCLKMPSEKIHSAIEQIIVFKNHLEKCLSILLPAMETADEVIEISNNIDLLKNMCHDINITLQDSAEILVYKNPEVCNFRDKLNDFVKAINLQSVDVTTVKSLTEDLYGALLKVQDELIQCTPQSFDTMTREIELVQSIQELENKIAVLEQFNFVDLSHASDYESCIFPQYAIEIQPDSLIQINDLVNHIANTVQDESNNTQTADLIMIEDFFKICKQEFSLLGCLITKRPTHKKIIRLLQEFRFLQSVINDFKQKNSEMSLTAEISELLSNFIMSLDVSMKDIENSLIKIINSQSKFLIEAPLENLYSNVQILQEGSKGNIILVDLSKKFIDLVKHIRPHFENVQAAIIEEMQSSVIFNDLSLEESIINENLDSFFNFLDEQMNNEIDASEKQVVECLLTCLQKHQNYKDVAGQSKILLVLKCLRECSNILKDVLIDDDIEKTQYPVLESEEICLGSILHEMMEPLQGLHSKLKSIQEQISNGVEEESIPIDISSTESYIQALSDIHKEVSILLESEKTVVDDADLSLIEDLDNEIHTIQENVQSVVNTGGADLVKQIISPLEEIEKSLHLAKEKGGMESKKIIFKDINSNFSSLKYFVNLYIKLERDLWDTSKYFPNIDIEECLSLATKINTITNWNPEEDSENIINEYIISLKRLIKILKKCDWLNTDFLSEITDGIVLEKLKHVFLASYQLLNELSHELNNLKKCDSNVPEEKADTLVQHIDQYIDFVEIVEEDYTVIKIDKFMKTANIARELRASINESLETLIDNDNNYIMSTKHDLLINKLNIALSALQVNTLDNALEMAPIDEQKRQQLIAVVTLLQEDLRAITGSQLSIVAPSDDTKQLILVTEMENSDIGNDIKSEKVEDPKTQEEIEKALQITSEASDAKFQKTESTDNKSESEISPHLESTKNLEMLESIKHIAPISDQEILPLAEINKIPVVNTNTGDCALVLEPIEKTGTETIKDTLSQTSTIETLVHHIEEYLSGEVVQIISKIASVTKFNELKQSLNIAKELNDSIAALEVSPLASISFLDSAECLVQKKMILQLQEVLNVFDVTIVQRAEELKASIDKKSLERATKLVQNLHAAISSIAPFTTVAGQSDQIGEKNNLKMQESTQLDIQQDQILDMDNIDSMKKLETLLSDVSNQVTSTDATAQDTESLRNLLDEIQSVIIKLKCDFDEIVNDTLNETLEDLECSVRSVQLQIDENSAPELLKDACDTLQLLVTNMKDIQSNVSSPVKEKMTLQKCFDEIEQTITLLHEASTADADGSMNNVLSKLNILKDSLKSLSLHFRDDVNILIDNGIEVVQSLNQMEEQIFSLEKDIERASCKMDIRDNLVLAVHTVYENISNMRSTLSSIQKAYMYENYAKPSENFLRSLKNVAFLSGCDKNDHWKHLAKVLRQVLNHFEDIKFYVNFDKTARIPSDAAFTKILLEELTNVLNNVLSNIHDLYPEITDKVLDLLEKVKENSIHLESCATLEVKDKIPIFKIISEQVLSMTNIIRKNAESRKNTEVLELIPELLQTITPNISESTNINSSGHELLTPEVLVKTDAKLEIEEVTTFVEEEGETKSKDNMVTTSLQDQKHEAIQFVKQNNEEIFLSELQNKDINDYETEQTPSCSTEYHKESEVDEKLMLQKDTDVPMIKTKKEDADVKEKLLDTQDSTVDKYISDEIKLPLQSNSKQDVDMTLQEDMSIIQTIKENQHKDNQSLHQQEYTQDKTERNQLKHDVKPEDEEIKLRMEKEKQEENQKSIDEETFLGEEKDVVGAIKEHVDEEARLQNEKDALEVKLNEEMTLYVGKEKQDEEDIKNSDKEVSFQKENEIVKKEELNIKLLEEEDLKNDKQGDYQKRAEEEIVLQQIKDEADTKLREEEIQKMKKQMQVVQQDYTEEEARSQLKKDDIHGKSRENERQRLEIQHQKDQKHVFEEETRIQSVKDEALIQVKEEECLRVDKEREEDRKNLIEQEARIQKEKNTTDGLVKKEEERLELNKEIQHDSKRTDEEATTQKEKGTKFVDEEQLLLKIEEQDNALKIIEVEEGLKKEKDKEDVKILEQDMQGSLEEKREVKKLVEEEEEFQKEKDAVISQVREQEENLDDMNEKEGLNRGEGQVILQKEKQDTKPKKEEDQLWLENENQESDEPVVKLKKEEILHPEEVNQGGYLLGTWVEEQVKRQKDGDTGDAQAKEGELLQMEKDKQEKENESAVVKEELPIEEEDIDSKLKIKKKIKKEKEEEKSTEEKKTMKNDRVETKFEEKEQKEFKDEEGLSKNENDELDVQIYQKGQLRLDKEKQARVKKEKDAKDTQVKEEKHLQLNTMKEDIEKKCAEEETRLQKETTDVKQKEEEAELRLKMEKQENDKECTKEEVRPQNKKDIKLKDEEMQRLEKEKQEEGKYIKEETRLLKEKDAEAQFDEEEKFPSLDKENQEQEKKLTGEEALIEKEKDTVQTKISEEEKQLEKEKREGENTYVEDVAMVRKESDTVDAQMKEDENQLDQEKLPAVNEVLLQEKGDVKQKEENERLRLSKQELKETKRDEEEAKLRKEKDLADPQLKKQEEEKKQAEEEADLRKEKDVADEKEKHKKEINSDAQANDERQLRLDKEKQTNESKPYEEEVRLGKKSSERKLNESEERMWMENEKDDEERNHVEEDVRLQRLEKEEQEQVIKHVEEEAILHKEKDDANFKLKEEQMKRLENEKRQEKERDEVEGRQQEEKATVKVSEEQQQLRLQKEKQEEDKKLDKDEERYKKQKEEAEADLREVEMQGLEKDKQEEERKRVEGEKRLKEEDKRLQLEKEKHEEEKKRAEEDACPQTEKDAVELKKEKERLQLEDEMKHDEDKARLQKEKDEKNAKLREEQVQQQGKEKNRVEDEKRLQKEKNVADAKLKEGEERLRLEKESEKIKEEEEQHRLEKEKKHTEDEARLQKEKGEEDGNLREEEVQQLSKDKQEEDGKRIEEEKRLQKEKNAADAKLKEKEERLRLEKEKHGEEEKCAEVDTSLQTEIEAVKLKPKESLLLEKEKKLAEDEARSQKEKDDEDAILSKETREKDGKRVEDDKRLQKEKDAAAPKLKIEEEERLRLEKEKMRAEDDAKLQNEKDEEDAKLQQLSKEKREKDVKRVEDEKRQQKEKDAADAKLKEEEEERLRLEKEAEIVNQEEEQLQLEKEKKHIEDEARLQKEKDEEDAKLREEEVQQLGKDKHEKDKKRIEEEKILQKENDAANTKFKEEEDRMPLEKEKHEEGKELVEEDARLQKEKVAVKLKEEDRLGPEKEKKRAEDEARLQKEKDAKLREEEIQRLGKEKWEKEEKRVEDDKRLQKEKDAAAIKLKIEEEERLRLENEKKHAEDDAKLQKEEDKEDAKLREEEVHQLGKETKRVEEENRLQKEKDAADAKLKEEGRLRLGKEAEKVKEEERLRLEKEKTRAEDDAKLQKEKDEEDAKLGEEEVQQLSKEKREKDEKRVEDEKRLQKEKDAADAKLKEEQERLRLEKEAEKVKQEEERLRLEKEKKYTEDEARLQKEKDEGAKLREEEVQQLGKEKREKDGKCVEEEKRQQKEKDTAGQKLKEDEERLQQETKTREEEKKRAKEDARLQMEKEAVKLKEEERLPLEKEKKHAEDETRLQKEKDEENANLREDEVQQLNKDKRDKDRQHVEEEKRVQKEKDTAAAKLKEEERLRLDKEKKRPEDEARLQKEKDEEDAKLREEEVQQQGKDKHEKDKKCIEEEKILQKENDAANTKFKEEEDRMPLEKEKHEEGKERVEEDARLQKEKVAVKLKEEDRLGPEKEKKRAEDEARLQKEKDAKLREEEIQRLGKEKWEKEEKRGEEEKGLQKEKDAVDAKLKEEEERLRLEKEAEKVTQEEEQLRLGKEKKHIEDEARLQKEKDEEDAKLREEEVQQLSKEKREKDGKHVEDEKRLQKEKDTAAAKLKIEEEERLQLKNEKKHAEDDAKLQNEEDKEDAKLREEEMHQLSKETKRVEEENRLQKEKDAADAKLKDEEKRMWVETNKDEEIGAGEEAVIRKEVGVRLKEEEKHEEEKKMKKGKDTADIKRKEKVERRRLQKEKQKEDDYTMLKKEKNGANAKFREDERLRLEKENQEETKCLEGKARLLKENETTDTKYMKDEERLRMEKERHQELIQENVQDIPIKLSSKLNGSIDKYKVGEIDIISLNEYKSESKEKPYSINYNNNNIGLETYKPPGYIEKNYVDINRYSTVDKLNTSKIPTIYKAQTLVYQAQLQSSTPEHYEIGRSSESAERRLDAKHRSKAHSETKSILEKRVGTSRDHKRKPVFSTYLTDRTAVESSRVKLTCSVLSSIDPKITWYKNGVLLDDKLKYKTKFVDGLITLEVLNAVPSDSAEYTCTVQNENGLVSTSANLKVYPSFEASPIPPTFTRSIRDTYHLAENELILECRIRGQPLPIITWLKDDHPINVDERYQAYYLADGVCRLAISAPTTEDSGKYTCKAENSMWSDQITHVVNFTGKESRLGPNLATLERSRFNRQVLESRRPHFTNVLTDYKVTTGGTIGLQVEIKGSPTRVEWLREGRVVTEVYRNAQTFVEHGLYTLALTDVTDKESGLYTCRAWSSHGNVDMNAAITVVQPNDLEGKPAIIVGRPQKDVLISVGEDLNISFRVQGEPRPKVIFMKGIRDITNSQRVCKMTSDDYVKFTLKRSVVSDAGTYCILARNAYGCDRAFVTVVIRQRASSENLISDWTYPQDDTSVLISERKYKSVPDRIPGEPSVVDGGNNWISLAWPKPEYQESAPVLAYKIESWMLGKEGGARWVELGITPLNSFDAFNLKQGEEYHFRVTPRNRYGWGEPMQTSTAIGIGQAGDRPEFTEILPGQLKVLVGETAKLSCSYKGKPVPEIIWMKNGHEIEDDDDRIKTLLNGLDCCLTIKNVQIEDEARYSCEASNPHGRASTYARMAVITDRLVWEADAKLKRERSAGVEGEYPPQFTMRLRDRRVQATYPVRLTCQVIGNPAPNVTWFKDGMELFYDSRHSQSQDEHFHTLEIAPTSLEDGGVYEAMARNSSGAVSCRCSLVVDKGIRAYVAPEFCCGLEPLYKLHEGEELRISAMVEAYPSVGVTWYRDGVRLRPSRRAVMTLDHDGQIELALAYVTWRDAGVYTCTASNEVGRASTSGKVEVLGGEQAEEKTRTPPVVISPDVPYSKEPMFIRKPRSSEAQEGDTVIIECEVIGDPKPDVYWLRDFLKPDYYRDANHFKRVGDGPEYRFEIPHAKLDYTGTYSVVASNNHGEAKAIISLQILAKDITARDDAHNVKYGRVDVIPRFVKELTDLLCHDGDAIEFECRVSGSPEPYIKWLHYNEIIRESPDFETTYEAGTARLKIKQVTAEDEGTYTCEASNSLGKAKTNACLVVYPPGEPNTLNQRLRRPPALLSAASTPRSTPRATPARSLSRTPGPDTRRLCSPSREVAPKFYTYPFNKVVEEGESVVFKCAVKGLPNPWTTWDKDGIVITPTARITIKEKDEIHRILEIEEVSIEDVGLYRITLENDYGRAEASARLEVISHKGKFYGGIRSCSASPRRNLYRRRTPSTSRQD